MHEDTSFLPARSCTISAIEIFVIFNTNSNMKCRAKILEVAGRGGNLLVGVGTVPPTIPTGEVTVGVCNPQRWRRRSSLRRNLKVSFVIPQLRNEMSYRHRANYNTRGASPPVSYYFLPRQRLNTLLLVHSISSFVIGGVGYLSPSSAMLFFSMESQREMGVGRILTRLFCSLIFAQGIMIWRARKINDGEIKRAFILAYFLCFLFSTVAIMMEHISNQGILDGKFFGIMKIVVMTGLTCGYGWFTFFQPPVV